MSEPELFRLHVDFNHCGRVADTGFVYLYPKGADGKGMKPHIREQFAAAAIEPVDGLVVLLVEERADANDDDVLCDMEVVGRLEWDGAAERWSASFGWNMVNLVPSPA